MTTITNYLHSSFVGKQFNQLERPFLIIKGDSNPICQKLWNYMTKKNMQSKSVIILNFGLRGKLEKNFESQTTTNGIKLGIVSKQLKQYILSVEAQSRRNQETYQGIIFIVQEIIKKGGISNCLLLVEGILSLELFISKQKIRKLFTSIFNINKSINQINVIIPSTIDPDIKAFIDKMGSCILQLSQSSQNIITSEMIIRRYTGYFTREFYTLEIGTNLKVSKREKKTVEKTEEPEHQNMGFSLVKSQAAKEQEKQIRKIIFPYLNVQDQNKCEGCSCGTGGCSKHGEEFIVLDDQQEDEDDVDV